MRFVVLERSDFVEGAFDAASPPVTVSLYPPAGLAAHFWLIAHRRASLGFSAHIDWSQFTVNNTDLSRFHHRTSRLFPDPELPEEWNRFKLSDEQIAHYHEHGYVSGIRLMWSAQVDVLREELKNLMEPNAPLTHLFHEVHQNESKDPNTKLFHALGAWRIKHGYHDLLWNPAFLVPASQLLGGSVRFWHDQLFVKPAKDGGVVAWHQDFSYWTRTKPMQHLTCWIALDDSTADNGCLRYIPGSHKWPLLPKPELAGDMEAIQTVLNDEQKAQFKEVPIELKKGFATFHHPLLVHGSYGNKTENPRRATVLNVFKDGTICDTDEELLQGIPLIKKGKKIDGQFFPLIHDEKVGFPNSPKT